jgi:hypothetical protein
MSKFVDRDINVFPLQLLPLKLRFVQAWIIVGQIKLQTSFPSQNFKEFFEIAIEKSWVLFLRNAFDFLKLGYCFLKP